MRQKTARFGARHVQTRWTWMPSATSWLIPAAAEACERPAEGMARHAGHDVDLVARVRPRLAVLERPIRRRVHFRRKVVREKEDSHDQ